METRNGTCMRYLGERERGSQGKMSLPDVMPEAYASTIVMSTI
jgi:hypothetical protein